jgi:hypothetical protein
MKTPISHVFALIYSGAVPKKDEEYFFALIKDFGGKITDVGHKMIKVYASATSKPALEKFFSDCEGGRWGKQMKNILQACKVHGPFELAEPIHGDSQTNE